MTKTKLSNLKIHEWWWILREQEKQMFSHAINIISAVSKMLVCPRALTGHQGLLEDT